MIFRPNWTRRRPITGLLLILQFPTISNRARTNHLLFQRHVTFLNQSCANGTVKSSCVRVTHSKFHRNQIMWKNVQHTKIHNQTWGKLTTQELFWIWIWLDDATSSFGGTFYCVGIHAIVDVKRAVIEDLLPLLLSTKWEILDGLQHISRMTLRWSTR